MLTATAFLSAISHYVLFRKLHGTMTQGRRLHRSYVTTLSLFLASVFQGCITGTIALSFTQHLWWRLRRNTFTIGRIEQFFNLRSNPLELTRLRGFLDSPMLFIMAIVAWLVPLAMIYPPSALTISTRGFIAYTNVDIPSLTPSYNDFDPFTSMSTTSRNRIYNAELISGT